MPCAVKSGGSRRMRRAPPPRATARALNVRAGAQSMCDTGEPNEPNSPQENRTAREGGRTVDCRPPGGRAPDRAARRGRGPRRMAPDGDREGPGVSGIDGCNGLAALAEQRGTGAARDAPVVVVLAERLAVAPV